MASLTVENYLKAIYLIAGANPIGQAVTTGEIAGRLSVSPGTVTAMLKTLSESGLATYTPYEGARLTEAGERLSLKVLRRHRLVELFLVATLKMPWDEVHEEAEHLEHAVSDRLVDRIEQSLGYPDVDPHGDPIPRADGSIPTPRGTPLAGLPAGARFTVVRVVEQDSAFLRYLSESGLRLGADGLMVENRPEAGALTIRIGDRPIALGLDAARHVLVTAGDGPDSLSVQR